MQDRLAQRHLPWLAVLLAARQPAVRRGSVVRVAILGMDADRSLCLPRSAV